MQVSQPYVDMTVKIMERFGVTVERLNGLQHMRVSDAHTTNTQTHAHTHTYTHTKHTRNRGQCSGLAKNGWPNIWCLCTLGSFLKTYKTSVSAL